MAETCSHQDQTRSKVSSTAHLVAYARGMEAKVYGDRKLFDDPYAEALSGEVGEKSVRLAFKESADKWTPAQRKRFLDSISVRTKTIDDYVLSCIQDHGIEQVVVLGAGLDTRPWRLHPSTTSHLSVTSTSTDNGEEGSTSPPPPVHYFEVDFQEVFDYKLKILEELHAETDSRFIYHHVVADLSLPDVWPTQLIASGFNPERRSLWLLEGFCNYLTETELRLVMDTIVRLSAVHSHMIATMVTAEATTMQISMHRFWPPSALAFFQSCGPWVGREDDAVDLATELDRKVPDEDVKRGYFIAKISLASTTSP